MIYVLIGLLFILCVIDFWRNKKIFSPSFVFNFIWFITLSLYQLKLSYIQHDLSNRTVLTFFVCVLSYNIVLFVCSMISDKLKNKGVKENVPKKMPVFINKMKNIYNKIVNKNTIDKKVKIAKYIVIIVFIIEVIYSGGVPLIWKITGESKNYFDFGIASLHGAFSGLVICLGAYSLFTKSKDKFLYLAIGVLIISRQILMSMIIEAIVFEIYSNRKNLKKSIIKILVIVLIGIIVFTLLGNFRSGNNVMNDVFQAKEKYKNLPSTAKWIYSYMTFSLSNFNKLVGITDGAVNYGASMLKELLPTVILKIINIKPMNSFYYLVSPNYNVSTYLPVIYVDFGIVGIAIFNALIALLGYNLYKNIKTNNSIKNILLYSVFVHNIVFLFFNNMFLYLPVIVQFVYILLIFSEKKEQQNGEQ